MAGPPLNGVAVSAVPKASHVASAIQFAVANATKIVVPQIGGYVCELVGLVNGFHSTLVASAIVFVVLSGMGLIHAMRERKIDAETNAMYLDTDFGSVLGMDVTTGVNYTVDDDLNASFDNFELDLSKDLSDKATVYANSDFDVNLDHTETVVGFKISF